MFSLCLCGVSPATPPPRDFDSHDQIMDKSWTIVTGSQNALKLDSNCCKPKLRQHSD